MGGEASRDTCALTLRNTRMRFLMWKEFIFRSSGDANINANVKYSAPIIHAQAWQTIYDDTFDKWKRSPISANYEPFPACAKKNPDPKGCTAFCYESRQDKPKSSVQYQIHSAPRRVFTYCSTYTTEEALNNAELQRIIPNTGDYLTLYFMHTNLSAEKHGIVVMHQPDIDETMYFFVDRDLPYDPKGLAVSPDGTIVCLLITSKTVEDNDVRYDVQVYSKRPVAFDKSFKGASFELEYEIPGLKPNSGCPMIMFDPRYVSSRLGIINVKIVQNIRVTHYFMVYDLTKHRAVTMPNENYIFDNDDLDLLSTGYSPDGAWVHAIVGHALPDVTSKYKRFIWIINADTLEIMKAIDIGSEGIDECFTNFLPTYSKCCQTMALRHRKSVKIYQLPFPDTLRALCRAVLLNKCIDVEKLNIPDDLKNYLRLKAYIV